jgi:putative ABC transport system permease protein
MTLAALLLLRMRAASLARLLVVLASRCAIQVFLLRSVVMQRMMSTSHPIYVLLWIFGVGLIAGKEAFSRIQYSYPSMQRHVSLLVLTGGFTVLGLTLALNVLGNVEPWFQPCTWIPVAGMLFGNTLSATALGSSTIRKQIVTNQDQVELCLARGARLKRPSYR